jgi:hypothetical protein
VSILASLNIELCASAAFLTKIPANRCRQEILLVAANERVAVYSDPMHLGYRRAKNGLALEVILWEGPQDLLRGV